MPVWYMFFSFLRAGKSPDKEIIGPGQDQNQETSESALVIARMILADAISDTLILIYMILVF